MGDRRKRGDRREPDKERRQDAEGRQEFADVWAHTKGPWSGYDEAAKDGIRHGLRRWKEVARRSSE